MSEEKLYVSPEKLAYVYQKLKDEINSISTTKTIILSNTMSKDEIVSAINNAGKGTIFDIRTNLTLYDVNISFPERSLIYSSTSGQKSISFGYSDTSNEDVWNQSWHLAFGSFSRISDISVNFSDNATANVGVIFGEGCNVSNCSFDGYEPFSWGDNCQFINCYLSHYIYKLSTYGSYVNCNFAQSDVYEGIDLRNVHLADCSCEEFKVSSANGAELLSKIKTFNPGMKFIDADGNEIKGIYATSEDVSSMIDSAIGSAMEGEY